MRGMRYQRPKSRAGLPLHHFEKMYLVTVLENLSRRYGWKRE